LILQLFASENVMPPLVFLVFALFQYKLHNFLYNTRASSPQFSCSILTFLLFFWWLMWLPTGVHHSHNILLEQTEITALRLKH